LPIVLAGNAPVGGSGADAHISALGGSYVPFVVAGTVPALPDLGDGSLVDLDYLLHSNDSGVEAADLSVWVTADAPSNLVAALADHDVQVRDDTSAQGRVNSLAAFGPGLAVRFELFAAVIILLLAAGVAIVGSTVDSSARLAELVALRSQGMPARAARSVGYAGSAVIAGLAVLVGVLSALLGHALVGAGLPIFSDDWHALPRPSGLTPLTLLVAVGAVVVVLGIASLAGAGRLVARVAARTAGGQGAGRHTPTVPSARTGEVAQTTGDRVETSGGDQ
jgi:hypothetical protein